MPSPTTYTRAPNSSLSSSAAHFSVFFFFTRLSILEPTACELPAEAGAESREQVRSYFADKAAVVISFSWTCWISE